MEFLERGMALVEPDVRIHHRHDGDAAAVRSALEERGRSDVPALVDAITTFA